MSGSPPSPTGVTEVLWGGEELSCAGEVERVLGTLTAVESALDTLDAALELRDTAEPVRSSDAAKRGRDADDAEVEGGFRLIRAASWLRDGMRVPAEGRSGFGASGAGAVSAVDIV